MYDHIPAEVVEDFRNHLYFAFKFMGLGEPTAAQYAMADALQQGPKDMQLQAGRGFGKSVITSCLASWYLLRDPNATVMVISATANKAVEFISMTRKILTLVPYCHHMVPGDHTTDNAFGFNLECRTQIGQDLSCYARGITSQITGSHANYLIFDDVEIEGNCETQGVRDRLLHKCLEAEQIRNKGGRVIFLGTPQIKDSIYNQLASGYAITKFPAIMPDRSIPSECENINDWIWELGIEPGNATQPERFDFDTLMERKAKVGPTLFRLHYQLDTSAADEALYPLRLRDLIVLDVDPRLCPEKVVWASSVPLKGIPSFGMHGDALFEPMWISKEYVEYQQTAMFIDPSGRGKDETAICIASICNGYIWIHEIEGLVGGYDDATLRKIAKLINQYDLNLVMVEANYGDGMFNQLLRPVVAELCGQVAIEEYKVGGSKEKRMLESLEPVMASHRLIFDKSVIRQEETQKQITRLTGRRGCLRHDDRVDVLSAAVSFWKDNLSVDVTIEADKNRQKKKTKEANDWANKFRAGDALGHGAFKESGPSNIIKNIHSNKWIPKKQGRASRWEQ